MAAYFKDCKCIEDVKEAYRKYAKALHPDNGGDAEEFKRMQQAYTAAYNRLRYTHRKTAGNDNEDRTTDAGSTYTSQSDDFTAEAFADVINKIIGLDGVDIEIVGSWIWLSGNTYPYKDIIKAAGFFWSTKHKKWYYNGSKKKSKRHSKMSYDDIKNLHGAYEIKTDRRAKLA